MPTIFITGIDTDVGKTVAAGLLARYLIQMGQSVITQKIAQTGGEGFSEDIHTHRQLMGLKLTDEDKQGLTCPYIFKLPASPHLAAQQEQCVIQPETIITATQHLEKRYDYVLVEGVGGLYVPLNEAVTVLDYVTEQQYPLIIVTSARLGSINHTLLTLEAVHRRQLTVQGLIYNQYPTETSIIADDSLLIFKKFLHRFGYQDIIIPMPKINLADEVPNIEFSALFG